ncbi:MAG: hypothetical protein JWQ21_18 [Herminiimonas sp.]|nr:hypothetical protein [Herminiimonas sp.]
MSIMTTRRYGNTSLIHSAIKVSMPVHRIVLNAGAGFLIDHRMPERSE